MKRLSTFSRVTLAGVLVLAAAAVALSMLPRRAPGQATGDPLPIRLIATQPRDSSDIFDPSGVRIGQTLEWRSDSFATQGSFLTTLIFEVPEIADEVVFSQDILGCPSDNSRHQLRYYGPGLSLDMARRVRVDMLGAPKYRPFPLWLPGLRRLCPQRDISRINVTLAWWSGPQGEAPFTFVGPFSPGAPAASTGAAAGSVRLSEYYGPGGSDWGVEGRFAPAGPLGILGEILVYDASGKRHRAMRSGPPSTPPQVRFQVRGLMLKDVAAVTVAEEPRTRTFHNIHVGQVPGPPEWLREAARRIGREGAVDEGAPAIRYVSRDEVLACIDIVRGACIDHAASHLIHIPISGEAFDITAQQRARVIAAAESWSRADNRKIRSHGIVLGLGLDFPAFADRALDFMAQTEGRDGDDVVRAFSRHADSMTSAHVARLCDVLLTSSSSDTDGLAREILLKSASPEAPAALAALARSDRPDLWYRVADSARLVDALGPVEKWPADLRAKRLLAGPRGAIPLADTETLAAAERLVAGALTHDLLDADREAFANLYHRMESVCGTGATQRFVVDFLPAMRRYDYIIGDMVRDVNRWNNVNIGGLGAGDTAHSAPENMRPWPRILRDAIEWSRTGIVPSDPFDGYRAQPGDLRVIIALPDDRESSVICLCPKSATFSPSMSTIGVSPRLVAVCSMRLFDRPFRRSAFLSGAQGPFDFEIRAQVAVPNVAGTGLSFLSSYAVLPYAGTFRLAPDAAFCVTAESADSLESAIAGTEVFRRWWTARGPEGVPAGLQAPGVDSTVAR